MEIYDLLKGRWLTLLVVAPIIAGLGIAVFFVNRSVPSYSAQGETSVPQVLSASPADFIVVSRGPARADFRNEITSEATAQAVASALRIAIADVRGKLSSSVVAAEVTGVDVSFTARSKDLAQRGLEVAVRAALMSIASQQRAIAQRSVVAAHSVETHANATLSDLERRTHLHDVEAEYRQRESDISNLQTLIANTPAGTTDLTRSQQLHALLDRKTTERDAYGAVLTPYLDAVANRDKARANADSAEADLANANSVVSSLSSGDLVASEKFVRVGTTGKILRSVGMAVVVTFALVLGLALLSARRTLRRRSWNEMISRIDATEPTLDIREPAESTHTGEASVR